MRRRDRQRLARGVGVRQLPCEAHCGRVRSPSVMITTGCTDRVRVQVKGVTWHIFAVYWLGSALGRPGRQWSPAAQDRDAGGEGCLGWGCAAACGPPAGSAGRGSARRCRSRPSACARRIRRTTAAGAAAGWAPGAARQPRAGRPAPRTGSGHRRCSPRRTWPARAAPSLHPAPPARPESAWTAGLKSAASPGRARGRTFRAATMSGSHGAMMPSVSSRSRQVRTVRSDSPV